MFVPCCALPKARIEMETGGVVVTHLWIALGTGRVFHCHPGQGPV